MKKVFLAVVTVVAFSLSGNAFSPSIEDPTLITENSAIHGDCIAEAFEIDDLYGPFPYEIFDILVRSCEQEKL
ncbi:MAG: hypothetical protein U1C58_03125 [Flavobacteriaceae bacterium]|nr:hypothetical protein [Flavobacteriaceae bacterium]MDZ4147253.1 hypothetical protein [Flavobacteriaceae bacterium]